MNGAKSTSTEALPFDVIDLTPTTVVAYRSPTPAGQPSATAGLSAGPRLIAEPGDVLSVRIFEPYEGGIFPTIQNPAAGPLGSQVVSDKGTIELPFAGTVKVAGLDPRQIEREIAGQLTGKAKDAQVVVEFSADRTNTIMVSGDVKKPGRVSLTEGLRTVADAINRAGGAIPPSIPGAPPPKDGDAAGAAAGPGGAPAADADAEDSDSADSSGASSSAAGAGSGGSMSSIVRTFPPVPVGGPSQLKVVVRRHGNVILDKQLSELLAGGDIGVEKGDEIVVRPNSRVVTVLGAVAVSGNVQLTRSTTTLADVLGDVHGLFDLQSNKTGVYLFRLGDIQDNPGARARIFRLDFMQPSSMFVATQFGMQPKDVIYVTNAPLVEYDKILSSVYRTAIIGGVISGATTPAVAF